MAWSGFYDSNRHRAFPFLAGSVDLPSGATTLLRLRNSVIVDCGFIIGPETSFQSDANRIYLDSISRSSNVFTFVFRSDATALVDVPLIFTRNLSDERYVLEQVDSGDLGLSASSDSVSEDGCSEPLWSGYLVTGDMSDLTSLLPGNGTVSRVSNSTTVEPAQVQNLYQTYVTSLAIANNDRTRVSAPVDCDELVWPHDTGIIFVNQVCIVGDIAFRGGYNASVRQSANENTITFSGIVGAGDGEPCAEIPLFDDEQPADVDGPYTGGPYCNQILRAINGVGGSLLIISGGLGATVTPDPDNHLLTVDVNMTGLAMCISSFSLSDLSESV